MKAKPLIVTSALLMIAAAGLYAFQTQPTVMISPAMPSTIYVNSTTTVTITAQISDSRVIPTGVNLIQVNPITGAQIVAGTLASQGGGIFSIAIEPNTNAPQLFAYEVSAPFVGLLKRSISLPITVAVAPTGVILPPDPGPAGMTTLAGIDSDGDGVRDDVERWIAVTQPTSARNRMALMQAARGIQEATLFNGVQSQAAAGLDAESSAETCLSGIMGDSRAASTLSDELDSIELNTGQRVQAYLTANSLMGGTAFSLPSVANWTSLCSFNPNDFPN
jgi:hypothetical protein